MVGVRAPVLAEVLLFSQLPVHTCGARSLLGPWLRKESHMHNSLVTARGVILELSGSSPASSHAFFTFLVLSAPNCLGLRVRGGGVIDCAPAFHRRSLWSDM